MKEEQSSENIRYKKSTSINDNIHNGFGKQSTIEQHRMYINILGKISLFKGLNLNQFKKIIHICSQHSYLSNEFLCHSGDESKQIFILIKGKLTVIFPSGKELARISPNEIVGEMGVFTGDRRSASVKALEESITLIINKKDLFKIFEKENELGIRVLLNVISDMAHKLRNNNIVIEQMRKNCPPGTYTSILSKMQKTKN